MRANAAAKERATAATYHPSSPPPRLPAAQAQPVGVGGRAIDSSAAPRHTPPQARGRKQRRRAARRHRRAGVPWPPAAPRGDGSAVDAPGGGDVEDMQAACRWPLQRAPAPAIRRRMSERMELCLQ